MSGAAGEPNSGSQPASDYEVGVIGAGQAGLTMGYYGEKVSPSVRTSKLA